MTRHASLFQIFRLFAIDLPIFVLFCFCLSFFLFVLQFCFILFKSAQLARPILISRGIAQTMALATMTITITITITISPARYGLDGFIPCQCNVM